MKIKKTFSLFKTLRILVCSSFLSIASLVAYAQSSQTNLPTIQLSAGLYKMNVQVASQPNELQTGLMWREEMPENEGMLFVFNRQGQQCFWMKNTPLPLSAAFIADDGLIVNIADMAPLSTDSHCSEKPVRFVLEMHQGWFEKRGIKAGKRIQGQPFTSL